MPDQWDVKDEQGRPVGWVKERHGGKQYDVYDNKGINHGWVEKRGGTDFELGDTSILILVCLGLLAAVILGVAIVLAAAAGATSRAIDDVTGFSLSQVVNQVNSLERDLEYVPNHVRNTVMLTLSGIGIVFGLLAGIIGSSPRRVYVTLLIGALGVAVAPLVHFGMYGRPYLRSYLWDSPDTWPLEAGVAEAVGAVGVYSAAMIVPLTLVLLVRRYSR